ncbi:LAMI_0H04720g1_1 [Lachancea mirantina]|uniref:LAMI_0H04720g1_1 n=1 Tax=Lachancea mirantina TaxID=1230905 RepID=A0A1G4KEN7_9SACH|nr:LAMI_0H04720g1_1 [Lachancea mirantina]
MALQVNSDLTRVLVAQYLAKKGLNETLQAFLTETGLPRSVLETDNECEKLEDIVLERIVFNEAQVSEKLKGLAINNKMEPLADGFQFRAWDRKQKFKSIRVDKAPQSLVLDIRIVLNGCVLVSAVERRIYLYTSDGKLRRKSEPLAAVAKICGVLPLHRSQVLFYACTVDGFLQIFDSELGLVSRHKIHNRIVTHIEFLKQTDTQLTCLSCGTDNLVKTHLLNVEGKILETKSSVTLLTNCSSFQVALTKTNVPFLFITRVDFTQVSVLRCKPDLRLVEVARIALNTAQFSAHSFEVRSAIVLNALPEKRDSENPHVPILSDNSFFAAASSHTPYMRLIVARVPPELCNYQINVGPKPFYDMVIRNYATGIGQNSFSQPILKALPDGSGLLVGGDDGIWAADLSSGDTWLQFPLTGRVKGLDINLEKIACSLSNKDLCLWNFK